MSEFSQSHHLLTGDRAEAVALLERAGRSGWVLPPSPAGWTPIVVDGPFTGAADPDLLAANTGVLALWVFAEDHLMALHVWDGPSPVGSYQAEWTDDIEVEADLSVEALRTAVGDRLNLDWDALAAGLEPAAVTADEMDPMTPARRVADLLGLGAVDWLAADYLRDDPGAYDAERVGAPESSGAADRHHQRRGRFQVVASPVPPPAGPTEIPDLPLPPGGAWAQIMESMDEPPMLSGQAVVGLGGIEDVMAHYAQVLEAGGYEATRVSGRLDLGDPSVSADWAGFDFRLRADAEGLMRVREQSGVLWLDVQRRPLEG